MTVSLFPPFNSFAAGGGAMGERMRAFNWTQHPLGPPNTWPQSLLTMTRVMLNSRYPMWLGWGPECFFFYNDAYAPTLGIKDAWALGLPAQKVWAEIWDLIGPRAQSVLHEGTATWDQALRLFLERSGFTEETYHTFSYSPVPNDDGDIGGLLCVVTEDTERIISARRLDLLRELAATLSRTGTELDLFGTLRERLAAQSADLPFALVYLYSPDAREARLACRHNVPAGSALAPETLVNLDAAQVWPARGLFDANIPIVVEDLVSRFTAVPTGPWEKPPRQAVVVPLAQQGSTAPAGFLVAGINPFRALDESYRGFLDLLAGQISAGLSNVRAYEAERRRAEGLAELDRAKTAFFTDVSHELRTPLTLMLGPMQDLLQLPPTQLSAPAREIARLAHRNGLRLLKLVNTLLDFSRLEAGRMQARFEPVDLASFTADLASSFRSAIERAGLEFSVECSPLPEPVYVDSALWEKIILNLLSNAFKFTLRGRIRIALQGVGDCIELIVQDTGVGIPAEAKSHLFERFYRVRGTIGRSFEGTGIGLALVYELVKLHGGRLHVESEEGQGSTFTVLLPTGRAHLAAGEVRMAGELTHVPVVSAAFTDEVRSWEAVAENDAPLNDEVRWSEGGGRVLVVDDNADMRTYLQRLLSPRFEVHTAIDGADALARLEAEPVDLLLTDCMLPRMDGIALVKAVRAREALRTLPVLMLSARASEEARVEALEAGADDFLVKPFSARELLARIDVHVRLAHMRRQAEEQERELRTKAESFSAALRETTERLSASLAAAGTGTFRWDLRRNVLSLDEPLERLLGIGGGREVHSLPDFLQLVHVEDRGVVERASAYAIKAGQGFDLEFRVVLPDGSTRWLEEKGQLFFDESGRPEYIIGACVDITKRKQAEMFVWRQRDVLEQIVQGAALRDVLETVTVDLEQVAERKVLAVVMMVEPDGQHLQSVTGRRMPAGWTQSFNHVPIGEHGGSCGLAVARRERVIVRDVMTSPHWEGYRAEAIRRGLRACWSTPIMSARAHVVGTIDLYYPDPAAPTDAEIRFVDIVSRTAAIALERDHAERALRASRAELAGHAQRLEERVHERTARLQETVSELESFSYSISHDMRAPLRAMQSFAQLLADECGHRIGDEGKDYIRRIIGASERMDRLIQDVLMYSKVARTELPLEPLDVGSLLEGILETYPQFQPPHAEIHVRHPLPRVVANPAGLTQCLANLIGNGIKFVAAGVVPRLDIWGEVHGGRVKLFVRDNGIGIDPSAHERIFHIFYQLDRSIEGTGIGLSVVRKAAERMGGSVSVSSERNQGSTFTLEFAAVPDRPPLPSENK